jgi:hypothetical protein
MTSADEPEQTRLRTRLARANEMIGGAVAELAAGRFNNAVNRAYYACFHIGVCLRVIAGDQPERVDPTDGRDLWAHGGTMNRLRQLLAAHQLPAMSPSARSILFLRTRADYYVDSPENGVSFEPAQAIVNQAVALRNATRDFLPWPERQQ